MGSPNNPKPKRPKLRGERWQLKDGRKVIFLQLLAVNEGGRNLEVLNENGLLESVYESELGQRLYPKENS
jgi:hypothetical protein